LWRQAWDLRRIDQQYRSVSYQHYHE